MTGTDGAGRSRIHAEHRGGLPGGATTLAVHEIMHRGTLRRQAGLGRAVSLYSSRSLRSNRSASARSVGMQPSGTATKLILASSVWQEMQPGARGRLSPEPTTAIQ